MTNEAIIRRMVEKETIAKQDGIMEILMDFRFFLSKLRVVEIPDSNFNSYHFMNKYSPIFKKKV